MEAERYWRAHDHHQKLHDRQAQRPVCPHRETHHRTQALWLNLYNRHHRTDSHRAQQLHPTTRYTCCGLRSWLRSVIQKCDTHPETRHWILINFVVNPYLLLCGLPYCILQLNFHLLCDCVTFMLWLRFILVVLVSFSGPKFSLAYSAYSCGLDLN